MSVTTSVSCWCATTVAIVPLPALSAAIRSATGARITAQLVTADPTTSTAAASAYASRRGRRIARAIRPGPAPLGRRPPRPFGPGRRRGRAIPPIRVDEGLAVPAVWNRLS
jgi:hypothetical protein